MAKMTVDVYVSDKELMEANETLRATIAEKNEEIAELKEALLRANLNGNGCSEAYIERTIREATP